MDLVGKVALVLGGIKGIGKSIALALAKAGAAMLTATADRTVVAGTIITFTNSASDTNVPEQTLTFSLYGGPSGASVNSSNGLFVWRPTLRRARRQTG